MADAVIGALRVTLGMDTAQFEATLKRSQGILNKFGVQLTLSLETVTQRIGEVVGAFPRAVKGAIDLADGMSKTAQKIGVTTEALSRLKYAADFSDISMESLSGGLQKLSKNMADVASGKGGSAATALSALGISVKDATGVLRGSDEVFADIADKFSRLEDGSTKTALAIQLFGRSGADLIPLLNSGRDGLRQMADESDRLGLTVSTKTGRAAEQFNDTLTKIGKIVEGVAMKVAEAALPSLQSFADLLASPAFAQAATTFGTTLLAVLQQVTGAIVAVTNAAGDLFDYLSRGGSAAGLSAEKLKSEIALTEELLANPNINEVALEQSTRYLKALKAELAAINSRDPVGNGATFGDLGSFGSGSISSGGAPLNMPTFNNEAASQALAQRLETLRQSLMSEEQAEMASHAKRLEEIKNFYAQGAISKQEQDSLIEAAQQQHADRMTEIAKKQVEEETRLREQLVGNVAGIFGSLATIAQNFGEKGLAAAKAFGVAEAIVNTAQGITKALAQGGIFGFVGAAAVAAAGAAQISTILSTTKSSTAKPSVNGTGSSATPAVSTPAPSETGGTAINLVLKGGGRYSRDEIEALFRDMNDALGDGYKLNVSPA